MTNKELNKAIRRKIRSKPLPEVTDEEVFECYFGVMILRLVKQLTPSYKRIYETYVKPLYSSTELAALLGVTKENYYKKIDNTLMKLQTIILDKCPSNLKGGIPEQLYMTTKEFDDAIVDKLLNATLPPVSDGESEFINAMRIRQLVNKLTPACKRKYKIYVRKHYTDKELMNLLGMVEGNSLSEDDTLIKLQTLIKNKSKRSYLS